MRIRQLCAASLGLVLYAPALVAQEFEHVHGGVANRVAVVDDDEVYVTYLGGVVKYKEDSTSDFVPLPIPDAVRADLYGIHVGEDGNGRYIWVVGAEGTVLRSDGDGTSASHWDVLDPADFVDDTSNPAHLQDVWFEDRDQGYIVGFHNFVVETSDGGEADPADVDWTDISLSGHGDDDQEWYRLAPFSADDWLAVADGGWIMRYVDGTATGTTLSISCYDPDVAATPWDLELWSVDFDGSDGVIVGGIRNNDGYIFSSDDSGATWTLDSACYDYIFTSTISDTPPTFYGVTARDDIDTAVCVGYGSGTFGRDPSYVGAESPEDCDDCGWVGGVPTNGVVAWAQQESDSDLNATSESSDDDVRPFLNDIGSTTDMLWSVGDFGVIRSSDDDGATWVEESGLHRGRISGGEFSSASTGLMYGQYGLVLWTTDGGESFEAENSEHPGSYYLRDAAITSGGEAVVAGDLGHVFVRDSSGTWIDRSLTESAANDIATVIELFDTEVILLGGKGGTLWLSNNYGATYTEFQLEDSSSADVTADIVDMTVYGTDFYYLCDDQTVYVAPSSAFNSATTEYDMVNPGSAVPTCLGLRDADEMYIGTDVGEIYVFDDVNDEFDLVTDTLPAANDLEVFDIEPAGASDWFFALGDTTPGQTDGAVLHFDGTDWSDPKSSMGFAVQGAEFFSSSSGLIIGQKSDIATWDDS